MRELPCSPPSIQDVLTPPRPHPPVSLSLSQLRHLNDKVCSRCCRLLTGPWSLFFWVFFVRSAQSGAGQNHVEHIRLQGDPEVGPGARPGERVRGDRIQGRDGADHGRASLNPSFLPTFRHNSVRRGLTAVIYLSKYIL